MGRIESPNHAKHNPCIREQELTYKCLNDNNYDAEKCSTAMENYNYCKSFWGFVQTQRRRHGKYPLLPLIEEREQVKQEFLKEYLGKIHNK